MWQCQSSSPHSQLQKTCDLLLAGNHLKMCYYGTTSVTHTPGVYLRFRVDNKLRTSMVSPPGGVRKEHIVGDSDCGLWYRICASSLTSTISIWRAIVWWPSHLGWPPQSCGWGIQRWFCRSGLQVRGAAISTGWGASEDRQNAVSNFCEKGGDPLPWDWHTVISSWVLGRRSHKVSQQKIQDLNPGFSNSSIWLFHDAHWVKSQRSHSKVLVGGWDFNIWMGSTIQHITTHLEMYCYPHLQTMKWGPVRLSNELKVEQPVSYKAGIRNVV